MVREPDYIRVNRAVDPHKFNVVIMRYNTIDDDFQVLKCSEALPKGAADALAVSWSMALGGVDIR